MTGHFQSFFFFFLGGGGGGGGGVGGRESFSEIFFFFSFLVNISRTINKTSKVNQQTILIL